MPSQQDPERLSSRVRAGRTQVYVLCTYHRNRLAHVKEETPASTWICRS